MKCSHWLTTVVYTYCDIEPVSDPMGASLKYYTKILFQVNIAERKKIEEEICDY